jgi:hypothetical protein
MTKPNKFGRRQAKLKRLTIIENRRHNQVNQ